MAEPIFLTAVNECVKKSINSLYVFPYFLNTGKHVQKDIPEMVDYISMIYPDLIVNQLSHFGAIGNIEDLILKSMIVPKA